MSVIMPLATTDYPKLEHSRYKEVLQYSRNRRSSYDRKKCTIIGYMHQLR